MSNKEVLEQFKEYSNQVAILEAQLSELEEKYSSVIISIEQQIEEIARMEAYLTTSNKNPDHFDLLSFHDYAFIKDEVRADFIDVEFVDYIESVWFSQDLLWDDEKVQLLEYQVLTKKEERTKETQLAQQLTEKQQYQEYLRLKAIYEPNAS